MRNALGGPDRLRHSREYKIGLADSRVNFQWCEVFLFYEGLSCVDIGLLRKTTDLLVGCNFYVKASSQYTDFSQWPV